MTAPIQAGFLSQRSDGRRGESGMLPLAGGAAGVAAWLVCEDGFIVSWKKVRKECEERM
jgi:hypothetical protein